MNQWPKRPYSWKEGGVNYISIPFTWNLPAIHYRIKSSLFDEQWVIGGPAVKLMPSYFDDCLNVKIQDGYPGVLQRINPLATRTTIGCPNRCKFCGIGQRKIEGDFREIDDWPDLPVICDNNLLAASEAHFDRVIDRLLKYEWCDFNQGLDARLLTEYHARRLQELSNPIIRLALDSDKGIESWRRANLILHKAGIPRSRIRSYILIGFAGDIEADWQRCEIVEKAGILPLPMWYHALDCLEWNEITERQKEMGWSKVRQRQIMGWYYKRRGEKFVD